MWKWTRNLNEINEYEYISKIMVYNAMVRSALQFETFVICMFQLYI